MVADDKTNKSTIITLSTDELIARRTDEGKSALLLGFQNALILGTDVSLESTPYTTLGSEFLPSPIWVTTISQIHRAHYLTVTQAHESLMQNMEGLSALGKAAVTKNQCSRWHYGYLAIIQLRRHCRSIELSISPR